MKIRKYKTINEVIRRGQIIVNVPVIIIMVVVPILLTIATPMIVPERLKIKGMSIGLFGGIGLGCLLAWIWWSFKIAEWRIWAFGNTRKSDWKALKREAIKRKLIWEDYHMFEKTEIRNKEERQKIEKINTEIGLLEKEVSLDDIEDDPTIPNQLNFYFKKSEIILSLILPLVLLIIGLYFLNSGNTGHNYVIGLITIGLGIYYTNLNKIKNLRRQEIQFSINEGIDLKNFKQFDFIRWEDTENLVVDTKNGILQFEVWEGEDFFEVTYRLNDYQIGDYNEFLRKMNIYLKRHFIKENNNE